MEKCCHLSASTPPTQKIFSIFSILPFFQRLHPLKNKFFWKMLNGRIFISILPAFFSILPLIFSILPRVSQIVLTNPLDHFRFHQMGICARFLGKIFVLRCHPTLPLYHSNRMTTMDGLSPWSLYLISQSPKRTVH